MIGITDICLRYALQAEMLGSSEPQGKERFNRPLEQQIQRSGAALFGRRTSLAAGQSYRNRD